MSFKGKRGLERSQTSDTIDLFIEEPGTVEDLDNWPTSFNERTNDPEGRRRGRAEQEALAVRWGTPLHSLSSSHASSVSEKNEKDEKDEDEDTRGKDQNDIFFANCDDEDAVTKDEDEAAMSTTEYMASSALMLIVGALIILSQMLHAYEFHYEYEHHWENTDDETKKLIGSEYWFTLWGSVGQVLSLSAHIIVF